MTGFKKCFKVTVFDFEEKFILCPKWRKWLIFRSQINTFELFFKMCSLGFSEIIPDGRY